MGFIHLQGQLSYQTTDHTKFDQFPHVPKTSQWGGIEFGIHTICIGKALSTFVIPGEDQEDDECVQAK